MDIKLIEKFRHIDYLDYKEVIKVLEKLNSIEEQLNYLKDIKIRYFDEFKRVLDNLNPDEKLIYIENQTEIWNNIFGKHRTYTDLNIQEPVFNKYFKNGFYYPKFTEWFIKYDATRLLEKYKKSDEFKKILISKTKGLSLKRELNNINDEATKAQDLFSRNEINIYDNYRTGKGLQWIFNKNIYSIEVLRVLDGNNYDNYTTDTNGVFNQIAVEAFYKHKLLKPFLEKLLIEKDKEYLSERNILIPSQKTLAVPYKFFKQLTSEKNKAGEPYLTEQELVLFLMKAFNGQNDIPLQKINIATRENQNIQYFFYQFMIWSYKKNFENGYQNNTKYLKILTNNFLGFNYEKIIRNFHKKPAKPILIIK